MQLVDGVERGRAMAREQTRQTRSEPGTDDEPHPSTSRLAVEREQRGHVLDGIGDRHDVMTVVEIGARDVDLRPRGRRDDDHRHAASLDLRTRERHRALAECGAHLGEPNRVRVEDEDLVDGLRRDQLASGTRPYGAEPDDGGAHVSGGQARRALAILRPVAGCRPCRGLAMPRQRAKPRTGRALHVSTPSWWG